MGKIKIGIVGVGSISGIYLKNITQVFQEIEIAGVCDLVDERAERAKQNYGVHKYADMHEMFRDPAVDIVLNITRPYEHLDVSLAAIAAGKHVYSEKPLGASFEEGIKIRNAAKERGVLIGGAPDTFLGAGIQTCRKLIDDGYIGTPVGSTAFMVGRGHETWHPDPEFYYKFGGGPMLDMGPYYLTALVNLLGPVKKVSGITKTSFPTRLITSQPHYGTVVTVDVPTHINGVMEFASGVMGSIIMSFDVFAHRLPIIEIYGSEGSLIVPDPNGFCGPVRLYRPERGEFLEIPVAFDYPEDSRSLGLADMAKAIQTGRAHRANGELTFHVLEVMTGFQRSFESGKHTVIESAPERPAPMVKTGMKGVLD
ncbi:MAG: Gfo/Idh/MocA family oxidoreductase [Defluviitaleaceae bacterium]|nr:Gfo/Idh/MocA family oxidoreductase [Defluviitaleaceae bacterium]